MYVFVICLCFQEIQYMFPLCYVVHVVLATLPFSSSSRKNREDAMWTSTRGDVATDGDDVAEHFELTVIAVT